MGKGTVNNRTITVFLLSITILVDYLNGLIVKAQIGMLFRLVCIGFFLYVTAVNSRKIFIFSVSLISFFLANSFFSFLVHQNTAGLVYDIKMGLKMSMSMIVFGALIAMAKSKQINRKDILRILRNNLLYAPILIIGSRILNIGQASYVHNSSGFKATFLSLNSINIALLVLFSYVFYNLCIRAQKTKWFVLLIYLVIPMFMLGTKSNLIFLVFVPVLYICLNIKKRSTFFFICIGAIVVVCVAAIMIRIDFFSLPFVTLILERQIFLFKQRDLITYLLSGRNWVLETAFKDVICHMGIFTMIFGKGYFAPHNEIGLIMGASGNDVRPIEMDWADIFMSYGLVGFVFTYGIALFLLYITFKKRKNKETQFYFIALCILIIFASTGGHVYGEAISATFLGIILAGSYMKE